MTHKEYAITKIRQHAQILCMSQTKHMWYYKHLKIIKQLKSEGKIL